jgi:hypothetical protein
LAAKSGAPVRTGFPDRTLALLGSDHAIVFVFKTDTDGSPQWAS